VRDKYLDAITAAVRQLPDDASPQDCERAASEAIHAARLAALPAEPTDPYTIAVVEGLPYELEVGGKRPAARSSGCGRPAGDRSSWPSARPSTGSAPQPPASSPPCSSTKPTPATV
jgi:hypothetical protein